MSLDALRAALEQLDEKSSCSGSYTLTERLAVVLPDGDVGAADEAGFVGWLLAHSEPAPFGEASKTKIDPKVRYAQRLVARGKAQIAGFDPASILTEVETVLSPRTKLEAELTDVIAYPEGGRFARHKDTPRSQDLVGTLVVGLPIAHTGGAFLVSDGREPETFDWSGKPDPKTLRWVALFSDVDHEIKPVTAGTRVTLVYALRATDQPREDPVWDARRKTLGKALAALEQTAQWPVMIACTRHVITDDKNQPRGVETLRGMDRELAEACKAAGYNVALRSCVAGAPAEGEPQQFPDSEYTYSIARLKQALTPRQIAGLKEIVTFTDDVESDEDEDLSEYSIAEHILDEVQEDQWVIRENARATAIHEALFSDSGYFGNEAYEAYIYMLVALEITRPRSKT